MKRLFLLFTVLITTVSFNAQSVDDVTLVVNGSGATKEEAIHIALRSAIEQAFGVFVSANTSIVNDELVKDEIATVTSGNVKSFKELESTVLPNGNFAVTLQAVVSTQKLAAYAKSKGSSCEFAGATFGANLKLLKLNQINTEKAFENLMVQLESLAPYIFDYNLELGQPRQNGDSGELPLTLKIISNENTIAFVKLLKSTINALALNTEKANEVKALGGKTHEIYLWELSDFELKYYHTDTWNGGSAEYFRPKSEYYSYCRKTIEFYSAFPIEQFNLIIENARASYIITSDMGHVFTLGKEKVKLNSSPNMYVGNSHFNNDYGIRLYAGHEKHIIIPEWPQREKRTTSNDSGRENTQKSRSKKSPKQQGQPQQVQEDIPQEPKLQPIELNTINTTLVMPIEDLMKISNFEVEKVNWIEYIKEQVEKEPENEAYYKNLISYYAVNNKYDELISLIAKDIERNPRKQLYYGYFTTLNSSHVINFLKWCVEKVPGNKFYTRELIEYWKELEEIFEEMKAKNPSNKLLYYNLGYRHAFQTRDEDYVRESRVKMYNRAIEEYKTAIAIDSTYVNAYQNIGVCYIKIANLTWDDDYYRLAVPVFEKLRTLDDGTNPEIECVWSWGLCKCFNELRDFDKEKEIYPIFSKHGHYRDWEPDILE